MLRAPLRREEASLSGHTSILVDPNANRRITLRRMRVRVVSGNDAPADHVFDVPVVRIGAAEDNELQLTDSAVSGKHCEIRRTPAGPLLRDLGSTNGIRYGGNKVRELYVHQPTRVRVGRTELEISPIDEVHDIEPSEADHFEGIVGGSQAMRELYSVLARVAPTELSVLVHGETGTGKELASRAIHARSNRRGGPMVVFDAAAVPHDLIARELFGHNKGAFTGADADAPGLFEKADGGTLFLDEIGELPLDLQPHLLRALEQRAVRRVGDTRYRPVDVRIVAATNRDLNFEVQEGRFRADLYYRLATVEVVVPALRDRLEDLDMLVAHFLRQAGISHGVKGLSKEVDNLFRAWRWPGNVRELRNVVQRAIPFTDGERIGLSALPDAIAGRERPQGPVELDPALTAGTYHEAREALMDAFELQYLEDLVKRAGGNLAKASRMGGVDRKTLYRLLNRHGLR